MTVDIEKLKALALAPMRATTAIKAEQALTDFRDEANPAAVLELIAEVERLKNSRAEAFAEALAIAAAERAEFMSKAADNNGRESDFAFGSVNSAERIAATIEAKMGEAPAAGTVEKDAARLAHGHRQDYYLLANARRVGLMPIHQVVRMPNWELARELFATGSTSAHKICADAGIDPYAIKVERAAIEAHNTAGKG